MYRESLSPSPIRAMTSHDLSNAYLLSLRNLEYFVHIAQERCYVILATEIEKAHNFATKGGRDDTTYACHQKVLFGHKAVFV